MIRTNAEYEDAVARLKRDLEVVAAQREQLRKIGLAANEVERALQPVLSFHDQLKEEVETYERMKRRDFQVIEDLNHIGRILIGLRIAADVSQAELSRRLGVSESMISRDERNEYQGISVERAQRIIDALKGRLTVSVEQDVADSPMASVG